ncbi:MAG: DUF3276 family protein [Spirochaetota bacterium]
MGQRGEVFSWRVPSANEGRTYFLNLKENRLGDLYLTIVESKKHGETDFERHQVMFFEEDLPDLKRGMEKVFEFMSERSRERTGPSRSGPPRSGRERGTERRERGPRGPGRGPEPRDGDRPR